MTAASDRSPRLRVVKTRWSGEPSVSFAVNLIGDDAWGTWVVSPAATHHVHEDGSVLHVQPTAIVGLIPRVGLWTAWFKPTGGKIDLSTSTCVDLAAQTIEFCDVELDVVWEWDSPSRLVDEDEFAGLDLSQASTDAIIREAAELRSAIDSSTEPFGRVGRDLLGRFDQ